MFPAKHRSVTCAEVRASCSRFSFGAPIESRSVLPPHAVAGTGASVRYRDVSSVDEPERF